MARKRSVLFLYPKTMSLGERYKITGEFLLSHPFYEDEFRIIISDRIPKKPIFLKMFHTKGLKFDNFMEIRDVFELPD